MGTPAERRALTALAALIALGAGVQVAQAHQIERAPLAARQQPALDAQLGAIDSARLRQGHRNRGLAPAAGSESLPMLPTFAVNVTGAFSLATSGHDTFTVGQTRGGGGGQSVTVIEADENATQSRLRPSSTSTTAW